jgi:hypothetical protein
MMTKKRILRPKAKGKTPKKVVWQNHHLFYDPLEPVTVRIRRKEHWHITNLQRFKELSWGAKQALLWLVIFKPMYSDADSLIRDVFKQGEV